VDDVPVKSVYDDWTGNVVQDADVRSFDPEAVRAVRATYMSEHSDRRDEISAMDDAAFLSHIGALKRGKVTVASMILLGKSSERILPSTICVRWTLLDVDGTVADTRTINGSMVLAIRKVASIISNSTVKIDDGEGQSFVSTYRVASLTEAMFNALQHQDYVLGGTIDVIERENESVTVLSRGSFPDVSPESFVKGQNQTMASRNPYLIKVMTEIGLVTNSGAGIRNFYLSQIHKHFPLPRFNIVDDTVSVTFPGRREGAISRALDIHRNMEIQDILDLDRLDSGRYLSNKRMESLISRGLVTVYDGVPCINLSYEDPSSRFSKGSDYDAVLQLLKENGSVTRSDVSDMLRFRDRKGLSEDQLAIKATNILQTLRKEGKVRKCEGSTRSARYELNRCPCSRRGRPFSCSKE
jgi:ATP-dependent DNA helicase RecG